MGRGYSFRPSQAYLARQSQQAERAKLPAREQRQQSVANNEMIRQDRLAQKAASNAPRPTASTAQPVQPPSQGTPYGAWNTQQPPASPAPAGPADRPMSQPGARAPTNNPRLQQHLAQQAADRAAREARYVTNQGSSNSQQQSMASQWDRYRNMSPAEQLAASRNPEDAANLQALREWRVGGGSQRPATPGAAQSVNPENPGTPYSPGQPSGVRSREQIADDFDYPAPDAMVPQVLRFWHNPETGETFSGTGMRPKPGTGWVRSEHSRGGPDREGPGMGTPYDPGGEASMRGVGLPEWPRKQQQPVIAGEPGKRTALIEGDMAFAEQAMGKEAFDALIAFHLQPSGGARSQRPSEPIAPAGSAVDQWPDRDGGLGGFYERATGGRAYDKWRAGQANATQMPSTSSPPPQGLDPVAQLGNLYQQQMLAWAQPKQQLLQWGQQQSQIPWGPNYGNTPDNRPSPWSQQVSGPFGNNQQDMWSNIGGFIQGVNNQAMQKPVGTYQGQGNPGPQYGRQTYDIRSLINQGNQMVQGGWQNPFMGPMQQVPQWFG